VPSGWQPGRVPNDVPGRALLQGPTLPDSRDGDRPGDKPLEGVPPQAEAALRAIDEDEGRKGAERAFGLVVATCEVKDPRAVDCLAKDRGALLVYDDFPHRRTSLLNIDVASAVARFGRIDRSVGRLTCALRRIDRSIREVTSRFNAILPACHH